MTKIKLRLGPTFKKIKTNDLIFFRGMALNALESFVINTKDKLEQDFYIEASTEEERDKIREKLNEVI